MEANPNVQHQEPLAIRWHYRKGAEMPISFPLFSALPETNQSSLLVIEWPGSCLAVIPALYSG